MANYKLSHEAKDDLIRIYHYGVENFGINQADKYFNALFKSFDTIAQRPFSYESINNIKAGYRRCVYGSDSIYFRIQNNTVEIMAIIGKQDLENLL